MKQLLMGLSGWLLMLQLVFAQTQTMLIAGKQEVVKTMTAKNFDIRGGWEIVDKQFVWDNGKENKEYKWNQSDKGEHILFSDSLYFSYTPYRARYITRPQYKYTFSEGMHKEGPYYKRYRDTMLVVNLYAPKDATMKEYEYDYSSAYAINENMIAFYWGNNEVVYLRRIPPGNYVGWKREKGWYYFGYNGHTTYQLLLVAAQLPARFQFIYYAPEICGKKSLQVQNNFDVVTGQDRGDNYLIHDFTNQIKKDMVFSSIALKKELTCFSIATSFCLDIVDGKENQEPWKFMWRVVTDTLPIRRIKPLQAPLYAQPEVLTKMHLEQGDEVEIQEEKEGWYRVYYYGNRKKIIEGWIKKEDVEPLAPTHPAPAAPPTKTARLLALEAACKSSGLTLVLAQTSEGTTFLINKGDKPLNYFIVQLPSKKQTLGFLTESLRGVEQYFIDDVEAGKVKFNAVLDANGKPVKDRQGFVLNYLTLPSGREAWAFVRQEK